MSAPSSPKQNAAVAEAMERARSEAEKRIQAAMATAGTPPPAEPPPPIRNIAPPPAAPPPAPSSPLKPPPITAVPERRPSVGLLNEIAEGKQLTPVEPGRQTPAPETMARGGLLNEIAKGKSLKHVEQTRPASNSATMARAGLLNELQHKRPKAAVTASSADAPSAAVQRPSNADGADAVEKQGWLHKRATSGAGIWQKRYFVLTRSHLSYFSKAPAASSATGREGSRRRGTVNAERSSVDPRPSGAHFGEPSSHPADKSVLALGELHVIPSGTGAEFSLEMKERVVRLRAADAKDAAAWVAALMSLQMASGQSVVGSTGDDETRLAGLVAPDVVVSVWDDARNDIVELDELPAALCETARRLRDDEAPLEAIESGLERVANRGGFNEPLPLAAHRWGVHDGRLAQLLRWAHPQVLDPAFATLQDHLGGKLQMVPDKESWLWKIEIDESAARGWAVVLRHLMWVDAEVKRTAAVGDEPGREAAPPVPFRFRWQLDLTFRPGSVVEVSGHALRVIDYEFGGDATPGPGRAARDQATAALKSLCPPYLEYAQIWRRPLHRLPVHKDVPRLLKGLVVKGPDGADLYRDDGTAKPSNIPAQIESIYKLFMGLARELDSAAVVTTIETKMRQEHLPADTGDVAGSLRRFLLESGLPENCLTVGVLKAVHQEIIFPAVFALRTSIYTVLKYKDIKGEWRVFIEVCDDAIHVTHRKWEQTQDYEPTDFFKFRWEMKLTFDRRMRALEQATVGVIDYEFGGATSAERQRVVSAVLKPWLAPGVLYKRMWNSLSVGQVPPPPVPTDSSMMVIEKRQYSGE